MTDPTVIGGVTYHVTPEEVSSAAAFTQTTADEIAELIADVRSYVITMEASWQGVAADQFQMLMHDYDLYARMLQDALTGIAGGLHGTFTNYHDTEVANLNEIQLVDLGAPPALFD